MWAWSIQCSGQARQDRTHLQLPHMFAALPALILLVKVDVLVVALRIALLAEQLAAGRGRARVEGGAGAARYAPDLHTTHCSVMVII